MSQKGGIGVATKKSKKIMAFSDSEQLYLQKKNSINFSFKNFQKFLVPTRGRDECGEIKKLLLFLVQNDIIQKKNKKKHFFNFSNFSNFLNFS